MAARSAWIGMTQLRRRLARALVPLVAMLCGLVLALSGVGGGLDESLHLWRDAARVRPASGQIHIVEIDARSLAVLKSWPWPRGTHAALVDQLRDRGAAMIAFDVDFSSASTAADDALFGDALGRYGGSVVLPTFRQRASSTSAHDVENLPVAPLRTHAFLGSVNVQPDHDGQLRTYSYGTVTAGSPRPSIAALLVEARGAIGQQFRIDTAIDPATIPRHSFIDVLEGKVPADALRGKKILIGATAIEMGDRYAMPGHGVLEGVVVQALAAETLLQGTTNPDFGVWPALIVAALCVLLATRRIRRANRWIVRVSGATFVTALPLLFESARIGSVDVVPALGLLAADSLMSGGAIVLRKLRDARLIDAATGLPNARALTNDCPKSGSLTVVAIKLKQYQEMASVLGPEDRAMLIARAVDRLQTGFPESRIYAIGSGVFALPIPTRDIDTLTDRIEGTSALFNAPIALGSRSILATLAFGISDGAGSDIDRLVAQAGLAAAQAELGGHRWILHSDRLANDADRSLMLVADVDGAIARGELYVLFQPKWDVAAERISGAEALVRWRHPLLGPISPDDFIPLLEQNNRMLDLTLFVVDRCMTQMHAWEQAGFDLGVAVNISASLLDDRAFVAALVTRLNTLGDRAPMLTLEVTESATIASTASAVGALSELRGLGARISIDDYGTGQSTLSYLKSFPADEIKIDKSFVTRMLETNNDQILVRSTIELAHELGFTVVAEGVESADCLAELARCGCDTAQGWHIGKPMTADALIAFVTVDQADPIAVAA